MLKFIRISAFIISVCIFSLPLSALDESSQDIFSLAKGLKLKRIEPLSVVDADLYALGEALFFEKELSGNRNISCGSCHSPRFYSGDGLALGVGQGAQFSNIIELSKGAILKRHTPHLINVGRSEIRHYFWDGRVARSLNSGYYSTPSSEINGELPSLIEVRDLLSGPLAAQALFPLLSPEEMLGFSGDNELSDLKEDSLVWGGIVSRLFNENLKEKYRELFLKAYPGVDEKNINIAHIANGIAEFQRHFFASTDTPFDRFMDGDLTALDQKSINGLGVFMKKGRCVTCHGGPHLSRFQFESSGAPQLALSDQWNDQGRKDVTSKGRDRFKFRTPGLRNIFLTGPYMHAGSLSTLEDVVNHYNNISGSLSGYSLPQEVKDFYGGMILFDEDVKRNELRFLQVEGTAFLLGLKLTIQEKEDLVYFLKIGLTDQMFKKRMDSYVESL